MSRVDVLGWTEAGELELEAKSANGGVAFPLRLSQAAAEGLYDALSAALSTGEAPLAPRHPATSVGD